MRTSRGRRSAPVLEHDVAQRACSFDRLRELPAPRARGPSDDALPDQPVDLPLAADGDEPSHRLSAIGDDDLLAFTDALDETAEIGAKLSDADFHGASVALRLGCFVAT